MANVFEKYHKRSYDAISPSNPANRQSGRNILITGASSGIGLAAAKAYMIASAHNIVIVGRDEARLSKALKELETSRPEGSATVITSQSCNIANDGSVKQLWQRLKNDSIAIDTLVLSAGVGTFGPIIEAPVTETWSTYETNVLGALLMAQSFHSQGPDLGKYLLYVSSTTSHKHPSSQDVAYASSKMAATSLFQRMAYEIPVEKMQIINFHPGAVLTPGARSAGMTEDMFQWDNEDLPAAFCTWASTPAAAFLHGAYVWANWDVGVLMGMKEKFAAEPGFLKMGLQGIPNVTMEALLTKES